MKYSVLKIILEIVWLRRYLNGKIILSNIVLQKRIRRTSKKNIFHIMSRTDCKREVTNLQIRNKIGEPQKECSQWGQVHLLKIKSLRVGSEFHRKINLLNKHRKHLRKINPARKSQLSKSNILKCQRLN